MTDQENFTAPAEGNPITPENYARFVRLFDGNEDALIRSIHRFVRDWHLANDVYQETVIRGMAIMHKCDEDADFLPWLISVSRNITLNLWRQHGRHVVRVHKLFDKKQRQEMSLTMKENPEVQVLSDELMEALYAGLEQLDEPCAQVVTLKYFDGMSIATIVRVTKMTRSQVKVRLAKAHKILATYLSRMLVIAVAVEMTHSEVMALTQQALDRVHAAHPDLAALGTTVTVGTTAGAAAATETTGFSLSKAMMGLLMPLAWIVSLVTTGHFCGWSLIDAEPSPRVRRWLVRQLLFCYASVLVTPLLALMLIHLVFYDLIGQGGLHWMIGIGAFLSGGLLISCAALIRLRYRTVIQADANNEFDLFPSPYRLEQTIRWTFIGTAAFFLLFMVWIVKYGAAPVMAYGYEHHEVGRIYSALSITTILALGIGTLHLCSCLFFQYLASISRRYVMNESARAAQSSAPPGDDKISLWRSDRVAIILFAMVTILPILGQIHNKPNERFWLMLEALVAIAAWFGTYGNNISTNLSRKTGWFRAALVLAGVLLLRLGMLLIVYD